MQPLKVPSILHTICYNKTIGGDLVSTGVVLFSVACRGLRWPRKKPELMIDAKSSVEDKVVAMETIAPANVAMLNFRPAMPLVA